MPLTWPTTLVSSALLNPWVAYASSWPAKSPCGAGALGQLAAPQSSAIEGDADEWATAVVEPALGAERWCVVQPETRTVAAAAK